MESSKKQKLSSSRDSLWDSMRNKIYYSLEQIRYAYKDYHIKNPCEKESCGSKNPTCISYVVPKLIDYWSDHRDLFDDPSQGVRARNYLITRASTIITTICNKVDFEQIASDLISAIDSTINLVKIIHAYKSNQQRGKATIRRGRSRSNTTTKPTEKKNNKPPRKSIESSACNIRTRRPLQEKALPSTSTSNTFLSKYKKAHPSIKENTPTTGVQMKSKKRLKKSTMVRSNKKPRRGPCKVSTIKQKTIYTNTVIKFSVEILYD
jgi:hypothetical protein